MEGIKYAGDGEFIISLETLLDLLEARIAVLRTENSWLGEAINRAYDKYSVSSYAVAESMLSSIIDGDDADMASVFAAILS